MSYVTAGMKDALKNHVLEEVPAGGEFRAFYLKEPGHGRMNSTLFIFTPEGIVIMGDLCPGGPKNQGSISDFNYGLGWFSRPQGEWYLCSKFLRKVWQSEAALEWVQDHIKAIEKGEEAGDIEEFREIESDLQYQNLDAGHFHDALETAGYDIDGELPGEDFPRNTAGWLCALQQKFAELYQAKYAVPVAAQGNATGP